MATKISTIYTLITAKAEPLKRGLESARKESIKGAAKIQAALNKINFRAVGLAAVAFGGTVAFAMKKAVDAASDLEEATGKFNVVFRDQIKQAEEWSKTLVASYGLSTREAKQYMSSIQDLLKPMGIASDTAAKLSFEVSKLAVDLGSFGNFRTADVMRDIESALVGNFETTKKYGVVLNETVVKQEALRQGIIKGKEALTAAQKAQIAYTLLVRGSADAIGDRNRTAKGYANTMKQLTATMEDVAAKIGDPLMPAIADVARGFNDWATENNKLLEQDIPSYTRKIGTALLTVVDSFAKLAAVYDKFPSGTTVAAAGGIIGYRLFGKWGPAKFLGAFTIINEGMKSFGMDVGSIIKKYKELNDAMNRLLGIGGKEFGFDPKGPPGKEPSPAFTTGGGFGGEAAGGNVIVASTLKSNKKVIPVLTDMWATYYDKQTQMAAEAAAAKAEVLNSIYPESNKKTVMVLTDLWATYNTEEVKAATRMAEEKAETLRLWEEENKKSSESLIQLSERTAWAMQENFSNVFFDAMTGELKTFGDYAKSILTSIQRAIADITAQMVTESLFGKGMKGGGWLTSLGSLFDGGSTMGSSATSLSNARWSPRAAGGPVSMGNPYLVGEKGPEWFVPGKDGTIIPNKSGVQVDVNVVNNLGQEADVSQSSSWISPERMVTDIILNKKMTSRGFRQGMRA